MSVLQEMRDLLSPLGLYALDGQSMVDAELYSYAEGLQMAEDALRELEREIRIDTAEDYGLVLREAALGLAQSALPLAERRARLLYHLGDLRQDFTPAGMERALQSMGFSAALCERDTDRSLTLSVQPGLPLQQYAALIAAADRLLPAHLQYTLSVSAPDWDDYDGYGYTFGEYDALDFRWDLFE